MVMRVASRLVVAFVVLGVGCKQQVGSSCETGDSRCGSSDTQLICSEGKTIAAPCRGPKGCYVDQKVICDISGNQPNDACSKDDEGAAVCLEKNKAKLVCRGGSFREEPCRGPKGCSTVGGRAQCDTSLAAAGDPCQEVGQRACNMAGTKLLSCKDGKMVPELACRGAGGCQSLRGKLDCDFTVAKIGDECPLKMEGKPACSDDRTQLVVCKAGKFVGHKKCEKGETCSTEGGGLRCEKGVKE